MGIGNVLHQVQKGKEKSNCLRKPNTETSLASNLRSLQSEDPDIKHILTARIAGTL